MPGIVDGLVASEASVVFRDEAPVLAEHHTVKHTQGPDARAYLKRLHWRRCILGHRTSILRIFYKSVTRQASGPFDCKLYKIIPIVYIYMWLERVYAQNA
jgi:hypothetical protein